MRGLGLQQVLPVRGHGEEQGRLFSSTFARTQLIDPCGDVCQSVSGRMEKPTQAYCRLRLEDLLLGREALFTLRVCVAG